MGKKTGKKKFVKKQVGINVYDSDDNDFRGGKPDPTASNYFHDEIDEFHLDRDKIGLGDNVDLFQRAKDSDDEILGFDDSDADEDEALIAELRKQKENLKKQNVREDLASDIEDSDDEKETESRTQKWGKDRRGFYGAGAAKKDFAADFSDSEPNDLLLEENEAKVIQQRQADLISESDFDIGFAQVASATATSQKEKIIRDLTTLSKQEKWHLVAEESPELLPLLEKYKTVLADLDSQFLSANKSSSANVAMNYFTKEKLSLWMDFCINVSFYLALKASRESNVTGHPVIQRILEYHSLIKQLESIEHRFVSKTDQLDVAINELEDGTFAGVEDGDSDADGEMDADDDRESSDDGGADGLVDGRRGLTMQIIKNRGLTPRRKKDYKNPRVKHRLKYRKAKIRRRGQIREVRHEMKPYAGELSGIRAAVKRGIRLK